jgi:hypothetical protein
VCNDIAVASDGTVYATESFNNRIHRLRPDATALDMWITDPKLVAVDGVALLADGAVYVNTFFSGEIFRIPVNGDGSAGALVKIEASMPLWRRQFAAPVRMPRSDLSPFEINVGLFECDDIACARSARSTHC